MTESVAQERGVEWAKHWIVAGTALFAALVGAGIAAAIDFPWHAYTARPSRIGPPVAVVADGGSGAGGAGAARATGGAGGAGGAGGVSGTGGARVAPAAATQSAASTTPAGISHVAPAPLVKPRAARRSARSGGHRGASVGSPAASSASLPGIDAQYDRVVAAECRPGLRGVPCRESVRWRLCRGRWNSAGAGMAAGASRCQVGGMSQ